MIFRKTKQLPPLNLFVGRTEFLPLFDEELKRRLPNSHNVLVFCGVGGIGKTRLREELALRLATGQAGVKPLPFAVCEISDTTPSAYTALQSFASALKEFKIAFPSFEPWIKAKTAGSSPPPLTETSIVLTLSLSFLVALANAIGSALDVGFLGTPLSLSWAALSFCGIVATRKLSRFPKIETLVRRSGGTQKTKEAHEKLNRYGSEGSLMRAFFDDLESHFSKAQAKSRKTVQAPSCPLVLFLDIRDREEDSWRGKAPAGEQTATWILNFAEKCLAKNILLVITVRDQLQAHNLYGSLKGHLKQHEVTGLLPVEAQQYLSLRQIGVSPPEVATSLQQAIIECANQEDRDALLCHPFTLQLCADVANEKELEFFRSLKHQLPLDRCRELIERFVSSLYDGHLLKLLTCLSVTPRFDELAATEVSLRLCKRPIEDKWDTLISLSLVSALPGGYYRINKVLRKLLRSKLSSEEQADLHNYFFAHWKNKQPRLSFYHHWWNHPEASLNKWSQEFNKALDQKEFYVALDLLDDWNDFMLDAEDREVVGDESWLATHFWIAVAYWRMASSEVDDSDFNRRQECLTGIRHANSVLKIASERHLPQYWAGTHHLLSSLAGHLVEGNEDQNIVVAAANSAGKALSYYKNSSPDQIVLLPSYASIPQMIAELQLEVGINTNHHWFDADFAVPVLQEAAAFFEKSSLDLQTARAYLSLTLATLTQRTRHGVKDEGLYTELVDYCERSFSRIDHSIPSKEMYQYHYISGVVYTSWARTVRSSEKVLVALDHYSNAIAILDKAGFRETRHFKVNCLISVAEAYEFLAGIDANYYKNAADAYESVAQELLRLQAYLSIYMDRHVQFRNQAEVLRTKAKKVRVNMKPSPLREEK